MAGRKWKILIVDDDPHIVRLLAEKLTTSDFKIFEALSGLEGIKMALKEVPDVILLDVMMPNMDGYQVCRFIKSMPLLRSTRVIFLTVKQGVGDRQRGFLQGGDDYLTKPFIMEELEDRVRKQLPRVRHQARRTSGRSTILDLPDPEEITDEKVIALMNRILDENVRRFALLEKISERLMAAVDRCEILRTMLASVVSPVGLEWDRVLLMTVDGETSTLRTEMSFGLDPEPERAAPHWRKLLKAVSDKTMEELFKGGLKQFVFQERKKDDFLDALSLKIDPAILAPGSDRSLPMIRKACGGKKLDSFLEKVFQSPEFTLVPLNGKENFFGIVAADRFFSHAGVKVEDLDHLTFLSHQTALALERQDLFEQCEVRADECERLTLLNESIMNGIDLGVVFIGDDGRIGTWNQAMSKFTGVGEREAEGSSFFDLFPGLRGTLVEDRCEKSRTRRSSQRVGHFTHSFQRGKKGIFDIRFGRVRRSMKNPGIVMIWEDVRVREKLQKKVNNAFRYLSSLIEHSGDAIVTTSVKGKIKSWNQGAKAIFGYEEAEMLGQNLSLLYNSQNSQGAGDLLAKTMAEGKVINLADGLLDRDGELVDVSITTSIITDAEKGKGDVAAIIRDVTERRRMESQLFQTEKLASLGIMAAGMAHEINNPLTSIIMYSQILGMKEDIDEEDRNCVDRIEEDAGRIADIVNSLLVFSRPSSRQPEMVDIHVAIEKAVEFVRYQLDEKQIQVNCVFGKGVPELKGVSTEIQEIFLNLLLNARDALPKGGGIHMATQFIPPVTDPPLGTVAKSKNGIIKIVVADGGMGIPKENWKKIFDPFFTTKAPGRGTGLGLSVVRRLVDNHRGTITVDSVPDEGSTFTVYFPAGRRD